MVKLYSQTSAPAAIVQATGVLRDLTSMLEPQPAIARDQMAPVVTDGPDGERKLLSMRWGFPSPMNAHGALVTNIRDSKSHWWTPFLAKPLHRCLVPVTSFCEYDASTKPPTPTWFAHDESRPLMFFAGIWRVWEGRRGTRADPGDDRHRLFAILTTDANSVVRPFNPKNMPLLLTCPKEWERWLTADLREALKLQRPAADALVRVVATGKQHDG
jgi:putative SOS response-associated peptidase YedK